MIGAAAMIGIALAPIGDRQHDVSRTRAQRDTANAVSDAGGDADDQATQRFVERRSGGLLENGQLRDEGSRDLRRARQDELLKIEGRDNELPTAR